jgi:hypothetical protein
MVRKRAGTKTVVVAMPARRQNKAKTRKSKPELTRLGAALRGLGGLGGSTLGGLIGMGDVGGQYGRSLGATVSKWLGSGDYSVKMNSVVDRTLRGSESIPAMHSQSQAVVIRHKEYLGEISGGTSFAVQGSYILNPGLVQTFPWLAGIAAHFQEYCFKGVVFHFVPSSGTAVGSTNTALGTVMMQTSYRSSDSDPSTKIEMLNEYWSSECVPYESFCHPIECSPTETTISKRYVRTGDLAAGDNVLLYDHGVTHIATSGQQAAGVLGDLWVTYEVELRKPVVSSNATILTGFLFSELTSASITGTSFFPTPFAWDSASWTGTRGNMNPTITGRTVTFPTGNTGVYVVTLRFKPATTVSAYSGFGTTLTNCTAATGYIDSTASGYTPTLAGSSPTLNMIIVRQAVKITNPSTAASIAWDSSSITGTISSVTVEIDWFGPI